ncbi:MAG: site-2 protease family protein [Planctomycetes bacterium]|nr:site-2 protease family protein [Planctomycetota bacterium]
MDQISLGLMWYAVFVVSTTLHEAAHAFAAMRMGDNTAYHGGQATLDPIPHIQRSPWGMVLIPLVTFFMSGWMMGWASVPYDPVWAERYPKRAAWMSLAGPAANLGLVLLSALIIRIGLTAGFFQAPHHFAFSSLVGTETTGAVRGLAVMVSIMFTLNLVLFCFNLIPLPPLDGTGIMEFFLEGKAAMKYRRLCSHPNMLILGIFIAWNIFDVIFYPLWGFSLRMLYLGV